MKALLKNGVIIQTCLEEFEVHPDYTWMDCPEDCTTEWAYADGLFVKPKPIVEALDTGILQQEKINALWKFCDTGDKSAIEEIKSREGKL